ncbi:hypothetical protein HMI54_011964 [Coelomomyces lativittatus]|nr:hypothetical protein HMI55_005994 [Coelomomyces lativittatus]KAJ1513950.1 hypothetical protein HMI56_001438 [Coelomomyces lativittatus]KAJ1515638.1 hypothetical protein HMI54_011964 [Coelomomyces lativittatus]
MTSLTTTPSKTASAKKARNVIDLQTTRVHSVLCHLGHPELKIPEIIHVAGTNGKGSTCNYIVAGLTQIFTTVTCFTSPPLVHPNDTWHLYQSGHLKHPSYDEYVHYRNQLLEAYPMEPSLTQFEVSFIGFLVWSIHQGTEVMVVEVGLGGLHDATNVFYTWPCACTTTTTTTRTMTSSSSRSMSKALSSFTSLVPYKDKNHHTKKKKDHDHKKKDVEGDSRRRPISTSSSFTFPRVITVITKLAMDHVPVLGTTLHDIVLQKLGIVHAEHHRLMVGFQNTPDVYAWIHTYLCQRPVPLPYHTLIRWKETTTGSTRTHAKVRTWIPRIAAPGVHPNETTRPENKVRRRSFQPPPSLTYYDDPIEEELMCPWSLKDQAPNEGKEEVLPSTQHALYPSYLQENALLAWCVLTQCFPKACIHPTSFCQTRWPGRLDWIPNPWLPSTVIQPSSSSSSWWMPSILVDGTHNVDGAWHLGSYVRNWLNRPPTTVRRCVWIMGDVDTKHALLPVFQVFMDQCQDVTWKMNNVSSPSPYQHHLIVSEFSSPKEMPWIQATQGHTLIPSIQARFPSVQVRHVHRVWQIPSTWIQQPQTLVIVTGSLYLVSDLFLWIERKEKEKKEKKRKASKQCERKVERNPKWMCEDNR